MQRENLIQVLTVDSKLNVVAPTISRAERAVYTTSLTKGRMYRFEATGTWTSSNSVHSNITVDARFLTTNNFSTYYDKYGTYASGAQHTFDYGLYSNASSYDRGPHNDDIWSDYHEDYSTTTSKTSSKYDENNRYSFFFVGNGEPIYFYIQDAEADFDLRDSDPSFNNSGAYTIKVFELIEGQDCIEGTPSNDYIFGDRPNKSINDCIDGLAGNDSINGLSGDDKLVGGDGIDRLWGSNGNDELIGVGSNFGVGEQDSLLGGMGRDKFILTNGEKTFYASLSKYNPPAFHSITAEQLKSIMPRASQKNINTYTPLLNQYMRLFDINTPARQAAFLAQIAVETGQLGSTEESLFYKSSQAIASTFASAFGWKNFPKKATEQQKTKIKEIQKLAIEKASKFLRSIGNNNEKIDSPSEAQQLANKVYEKTTGNYATGDGWRFRGRGLLQLTGRNNYEVAENILDQKGIKTNLVQELNKLKFDKDNKLIFDKDNSKLDKFSPSLNAAAATAFWEMNKLNTLADQEKFEELTGKVNRGKKHLSERQEFYKRAKKVLLSSDLDYASINDFNPKEDSIVLEGSSSNYLLSEVQGGYAILLEDGVQGFTGGDRLIAFVENNKQQLSLSAGYFQFV